MSQFKEQIKSLTESLYEHPDFGRDPRINDTIEELKAFQKEINSYIVNSRRFGNEYLSVLIDEIKSCIQGAMTLLETK